MFQRATPGATANDESFEQPKAAGIDVQWAIRNPMTHEKSIVVDEQAAMVATYNLMIWHFTLTRDHGIITHDPSTSRRSSTSSTPTGSTATSPSHHEGLL